MTVAWVWNKKRFKAINDVLTNNARYRVSELFCESILRVGPYAYAFSMQTNIHLTDLH